MLVLVSHRVLIFLAKIVGGKKSFYPTDQVSQRIQLQILKKSKKVLKWKPTVKFSDGIRMMLKNINDWNNAPLWTKKQ